MSIKSDFENILRSSNGIVVSTYFLELFFLSVRGENSAALMTLVLDDILRKLCLLFSSIPLFTPSFSSILTNLFLKLIYRDELYVLIGKNNSWHMKKNPTQICTKKDRWRERSSAEVWIWRIIGNWPIRWALGAARCAVILWEGPERF